LSKSFLDRRHESPDYDIEVWITGVLCPDGKVHWNVEVEGEDDPFEAAGILERAVEVLREADEKKDEQTKT